MAYDTLSSQSATVPRWCDHFNEARRKFRTATVNCASRLEECVRVQQERNKAVEKERRRNSWLASASLALGELSVLASKSGLIIDRKSAHQLPKITEEELRRQFDRVDTNRTGQLERRDIQNACASLGLPSSDDYVSELMKQYHTRQAGAVSFHDFSAYVRRQEQQMQRAFLAIDKDGTGVITARGALHAVHSLGIDAKEKDAVQMIKLLDASSDGVVSYAEFRMYLCLLPRAHMRQNSTWNWLGSAVDRVVMAPRTQPLKQLFAGSVSGAVSKTLTAPLERARMMMQATPGENMSVRKALTRILREEGPAGLFRGNVVSLVKIVPASGLQFAVFESGKDFLMLRSSRAGTGDLSTGERLLAGSAAGFVSTFVCYPLDTIKTQMSVVSSKAVSGNLSTVGRLIIRQQGALALYKGLVPTLVTDIIGNGLGFTLYDTFNSQFRKRVGRKPQPAEKGLLGGLAACCCMTITMPLEVVITRMRIQGSGGRPMLYKNTADCLVKISRTEGVTALWKGASATYGKVFPQIGIVYFIFELVSRELAIKDLQKYDLK